MGLFSSCTKSDVAEVLGGKQIKVVAHATNGTPDTKVVVTPNEDGTYASVWGDEESIKIFEVAVAGKETKLAAVTSDSYTKSTDGKTADFGFSLEAVDADNYDYYAISPASAWGASNPKKDGIYVKLPTVQTPGVDAVDPTSIVVLAKDLAYDAQPEELQLAFRHVTAYGKMTLANAPVKSGETVKSIVITAADKALAGGFDYVYSDGSLSPGSSSSSNSITLNTNSLENVWFAVEPVAFEAGEVMTVAIVTDQNTYTRDITFASAKSFKAGHVAKMTVDMSTAVTVDYSGTYVPMVNVGGNYLALSSTANGTRLSAVSVEYDGVAASFSTTDATIVWTLAKDGSVYTMADQSTPAKYLSWNKTSGNAASTSSTGSALQVSQNANGTYKIALDSDPTRYLQYNKASNAQYYAFYTSAQEGDIYLVPADYEASPADPAVEGVAAIKEKIAGGETGTFQVALDGAVVTYVNGNGAYIEDESGAVYVFKSGHGLVAGKSITGTVAVVGKMYNGLPEVTSIDLSAATVEEGATIPLTEVTIENLLADYDKYLSRRVKISAALVTNGISGTDRDGVIFQDLNSIAVRAQAVNTVEMSEEDVVDVICFPSIYNTTKQLAVWSTDDNVFVTALGPGAMSLTETTKTLAPGATYTIGVTSTEAGATFVYASSDPTVAEVSAAGVVTAKKVGTAVITVALKGTSTYACNIAKVTITVEKSGITYETETLSGNFTYDEATKTLSMTTSKGTKVVQAAGTGNAVGSTYSSATTLRIYVGNTLSFTTESSARKIVKIEFTHTDTYCGGSDIGSDIGDYTRGTTSSAWEGSATSVVITNKRGASDQSNIQLRPTSIKITYEL